MMSKLAFNTLIQHLKKAQLVTKAMPWMIEGIDDLKTDVRYVGIRPPTDWVDIMSPKNNLLIKCLRNRKQAWLEVYLANKTPFIKLKTVPLDQHTKWELVLGAIKHRLKQEKEAVLNHQEQVGNLYQKIASSLL